MKVEYKQIFDRLNKNEIKISRLEQQIKNLHQLLHIFESLSFQNDIAYQGYCKSELLEALFNYLEIRLTKPEKIKFEKIK